MRPRPFQALTLLLFASCSLAQVAPNPGSSPSPPPPPHPAPPATPAADRSHEAAILQLRDALAALRSLMVYYHAQHGERFPSFDALNEWAAFLKTTTPDGRFTVNGMCGPYLLDVPINPLTRSDRLLPASADPASAGDAGWIYDERTGALRALVPPAAADDARRFLSPSDYLILPAP